MVILLQLLWLTWNGIKYEVLFMAHVADLFGAEVPKVQTVFCRSLARRPSAGDYLQIVIWVFGASANLG